MGILRRLRHLGKMMARQCIWDNREWQREDENFVTGVAYAAQENRAGGHHAEKVAVRSVHMKMTKPARGIGDGDSRTQIAIGFGKEYDAIEIITQACFQQQIRLQTQIILRVEREKFLC